MADNKRTVLIVDDEASIRKILEHRQSSDGYPLPRVSIRCLSEMPVL